MGANSKIEWTDHTFNPWIGCTHVSPACDHCYAEAYAKRTGQGELWNGNARRRTSPTNWRMPIVWSTAALGSAIRPRVFCASLADVFDNEVDPTWRSDLFKLIEATQNLDWLLLTKRIGNVMKLTAGVSAWPNVWLGATVVNQAEADRDIPKLLATPAAIRFLSIEPMLGPMDLRKYLVGHEEAGTPFSGARTVGGCESYTSPVDWVIVGGESGPSARPIHVQWARDVRDQCAAAGVPFLFKQWGEWHPAGQRMAEPPEGIITRERAEKIGDFALDRGESFWKLGKKKSGRYLDGITHDGFPET